MRLLQPMKIAKQVMGCYYTTGGDIADMTQKGIKTAPFLQGYSSGITGLDEAQEQRGAGKLPRQENHRGSLDRRARGAVDGIVAACAAQYLCLRVIS